MSDRTSFTYRADMPGSNPDMNQIGGTARDAFMRARDANALEQDTQSRSEEAPTKAEFFEQRRSASPTINHDYER